MRKLQVGAACTLRLARCPHATADAGKPRVANLQVRHRQLSSRHIAGLGPSALAGHRIVAGTRKLARRHVVDEEPDRDQPDVRTCRRAPAPAVGPPSRKEIPP